MTDALRLAESQMDFSSQSEISIKWSEVLPATPLSPCTGSPQHLIVLLRRLYQNNHQGLTFYRKTINLQFIFTESNARDTDIISAWYYVKLYLVSYHWPPQRRDIFVVGKTAEEYK